MLLFQQLVDLVSYVEDQPFRSFVVVPNPDITDLTVSPESFHQLQDVFLSHQLIVSRIEEVYRHVGLQTVKIDVSKLYLKFLSDFLCKSIGQNQSHKFRKIGRPGDYVSSYAFKRAKGRISNDIFDFLSE